MLSALDAVDSDSFFSDEDIRCFDENGYIILEDAFDAQEISSVIEQIDPFEYKAGFVDMKNK